ncbi:MAG TPA: hypothetical protein VG929_01530 [Actinomycetota bacterium]|nr:hypothetical protein [Actinomycetota bacterium]
MRWVRWGLNDCQISRMTGIPRRTVRDWRVGKSQRRPKKSIHAEGCPTHGGRLTDRGTYAYLLGLYLGDGYIVRMGRTFRLRIFLDDKYPLIIQECAAALRCIRDGPIGWQQKIGCTEISAYWNHWPCLFPQHGPGMKHDRDVSLVTWQKRVVERHPERLLRGLIHSDGSRDLNWVKGKSYPRYQFANYSKDIQEVFTWACKLVGVHWTQPFWKTLTVSRRPDVEKVDRFIGPKK